MNRFIAFCGLDCESCDVRIATITDDDALRQRTAALWSSLNGVPITPEMIRCDGCRLCGAKTPFCNALCPIRRCALEKAGTPALIAVKWTSAPPSGRSLRAIRRRQTG